jgi:hypothetical protein
MSCPLPNSPKCLRPPTPDIDCLADITPARQPTLYFHLYLRGTTTVLRTFPTAVAIATLGRLYREPYWFWVCCGSETCMHIAPVALAAFMIR